MEERIDIMTDIETLGVKDNVAIIQLSAIAFNIKTGEYIDTFNNLIDVSKVDGLIIDGSTLKWWLETNKELLTNIITQATKQLDEVLFLFNEWIEELNCHSKKKFLWGNGILFDNRIIQDQMRKYGLDYPIFYRNDRDVRTIVELAGIKENITEKELKQRFNNDSLTKHDAFDDTRYQIELVCGCYKIIMK